MTEIKKPASGIHSPSARTKKKILMNHHTQTRAFLAY